MPINNHRNGLEVRVYNPITQKKDYVGRYLNENDAKKAHIQYETKFYSENKILIPKCITVHKNKGFSLSTSIKKHGKSKTIHLGYFKTMEEAKQGKIDFISKFI